QIVALGAIHSDLNGSNRLLLGHRRMLDEVLGASAYFFRNEAGPLLKVVIDADINDNVLDAVMTAQDIDGGTSAQEVENHLCGHFARIGANAGTRYSMVSGKREDRLLIQNEIRRSPHHAELTGELFQPPKAPCRLREVIEPPLQLRAELTIGALNLRQGNWHRLRSPQSEKLLQNNRL